MDVDEICAKKKELPVSSRRESNAGRAAHRRQHRQQLRLGGMAVGPLSRHSSGLRSTFRGEKAAPETSPNAHSAHASQLRPVTARSLQCVAVVACYSAQLHRRHPFTRPGSHSP